MEHSKIKIPMSEFVAVVDEFLNDYGLYPQFEAQIKEKGYELEEFDIDEE